MRGKAKWVGSKKSKPITILPCDARLKFLPISTPPPLQSEKNLHGAKRKCAGKIVILNISFSKTFLFLFHINPLLLPISKKNQNQNQKSKIKKIQNQKPKK